MRQHFTSHANQWLKHGATLQTSCDPVNIHREEISHGTVTMNNHSIIMFALIVIFLGFNCSCESARWRDHPRSDTRVEAIALEAADELDVIAKDLDEYGSITASSVAPLLTSSDRFKFDLDLTPRQMFERSTVQGQSTIRRFEELAVRLSARYAASVPVPEGADTSETLENQSAPDLPAGSGRATPDKFTDPYATPDADLLDIPLRDLIKRVSDDHMTLKLLEWMSGPDKDGLGANKLLFMSVFNVNVRPGRITYEGYHGEIDITFEYWDHKHQQRVKSPIPEAFAVFPAVDSHVLDLRTSIREQFALAVMLEAAFPTMGGQLAADYLERLEQDAASRMVSNTVVGYTAGGNHVGWRFSPAFTAQADPSDIRTGPDGHLQAQSFPALVLLLCNKDVVSEKFGGKVKSPPCTTDPGKDQKVVKSGFDQIHMSTSPRWLRAPSAKADRKGSLFGELDRLDHPRLSESIVMDWAIRLERVRKLYGKLLNKLGPKTKPQLNNSMAINIVKRFNMLRAQSVGQPVYLSLPEPKKPQQAQLAISGIEPRRGWVDRDSYFIVRGRGFTDKTKFYIGGVEAQIVSITPAGGGSAEWQVSVDGNAAVVKVAADSFPHGTLGPQDVMAFRKGRKASPVKKQEVDTDEPTDQSGEQGAADPDPKCKDKEEKDEKNEKGASAYLHNAIEFNLSKESVAKELTKRFAVEWAGEPGNSQIISIWVHPEHKLDVAELIEALMHRERGTDHGDNVDIDIDVDAQEHTSKKE